MHDEKRKKIIIIEDNVEIADILAKRLQGKNYEVRWITTGLDVISMLMGNDQPDAIILDLMIPERSGLELLNPIAARWKGTKVFVFSAHSKYEISIPLGLTEGFFLKSDGVDRLLQALEQSLGATG